MFLELWKKECGQVAKSLIYWLYVIVLAVFFVSQLGSLKSHMLKEPKKGQDSYAEYGTMQSNDEREIMRTALSSLAQGIWYEDFTTYPVGFAKHITLSEMEMDEIEGILLETTGMSRDAAGEDIARHFQENNPENSYVPYVAEPKEGLAYEDFLRKMERVSEILGPGSDFTEERMKASAKLPMDYEGAMEAYRDLVEKDGYTGGYLRLFCDYMGIILGILPVFVAATRILRDKRAQMQDLIFARKASSFAIITSRYAAMLCMMMAPVMVLSLVPVVECVTFTKGSGIALDYLAFLKYDLGWLLPTVMVVTALGLFLTEITESALAVLVQGIWWFAAISLGVDKLHGGQYGWNLIPRHNTEINYSGFANGFTQLVYNRIFYVILAFALTAVTILIYEKKRKGHLRRRGKILRNYKRTDEA